jgi:hypothetical protein
VITLKLLLMSRDGFFDGRKRAEALEWTLFRKQF